MSPQRDDEHEAPGDDGDQQQVRRLLAAAAAPEGDRMPEDVAVRLDHVLARLVAEREAGGATTALPPAPPDQVAGVTALSTRRGRLGSRLLVAAAAVCVLALGVGVAVDGLTGGGSQSSTAESAGGASQQDRSTRSGAVERRQAPADGLPPAAAVRLRTGSLEADLRRVEDSGLAVPVASSPRRWKAACAHPRTAAGDEWVPVRLDGRPAVLVLRAPEGGRRTGEVFVCGSSGAPAASATVSAP